jgi:FkbH-like protein
VVGWKIITGENMQPLTLTDKAVESIVFQRKKLRRQLLASSDLKEIRIAVLSGTTTNELVDLLEILLLQSGFRPTFHQGEYGRFYEDAVLEPESIEVFKPDLVYIHTCSRNIIGFPPVSCTNDGLSAFLESELNRYRSIWSSLRATVGRQIIQNNFEPPLNAVLGNLDSVNPGGATRFINEMNSLFALEARSNSGLTIQDLSAISSNVGLTHWSDPERWYRYKIANTIEGSFAIASSIASLVRAMFGRTRKVLVLDLDNTLWGGVIGDDGVDKIVLGRETPIAEAYTAFQEYCLSLRERGVLLAVCSKNNEETAKLGFGHPDSVLKLEHFSSFKANWEPKYENILKIAEELQLGVDSLVFVDDNPAERDIVEAQIAGIAVPDVGSDVTRYASIIEFNRYFEQLSLGKEDLVRAKLYEENAQRTSLERKFSNYGEYLDSLEMTAEVDIFHSTYVERIAQLTNKSNQFNLTTRRYTTAEIQAMLSSDKHIGLYGKLTDRFGENGLVSVVLGSIDHRELHLDLWLMSCRVLKRDMELAMLDGLVERARDRRVEVLYGYYLPTPKNGMVADHYAKLGFSLISTNDQGASVWSLDITNYGALSRHIKILEPANG